MVKQKLSMAMVTHAFSLLSALVFLPCASSSVSFSLTYRDAASSPVRTHQANPSDLPEDMPMREFVAAGRAMKERIDKQRRSRFNGKGHPSVLGRFSYLKENVGDFYLTVPVGSPPQTLIFTLDTGSELTWSQCSPCKVCSTSGGPSFAFNKSSSYHPIPCSSPICTQSLGFNSACSNSTGFCIFQLQYGDGSTDAGYISVDAFHFGRQFAQPLVFGCAVIDLDTVAVPTSGIMGLNSGPFSFTSQLFSGNPDLANKFAYCLPDRFANLNSLGSIEFGNYKLPSKLRYTPFVPPYGPLGDLYYYVKLEGITVGESLIKVGMKKSESEGLGTGGTIFDSGTAITHFSRSVYEELIGEMRKQTAKLAPFALNGTASDVCYQVGLASKELPNVPMVTLHFAGMVELELEARSVLYPTAADDKNIIFCLAFTTSPANLPLNIIGNYQQQNYWVEYNLQTSSLGLGKATCVRSS